MLTPTSDLTEEQFQTTFTEAPEGAVVFDGTQDGYRVTLTKVEGQPVVHSEQAQPGVQSFCHAAAMSAILAMGAAGMAFIAASGGGVILGVTIGARAAGQISAALAGGSGFDALVAQYIC